MSTASTTAPPSAPTGTPRIVAFPELQHYRRRTVAMMAVAAPEPEADTNGWDTVYAIPIDEVNKAIVKKGKSPTAFDFTMAGDSVKGTFGPWQITPKGDASIIVMSAPIVQGTGTYQDQDYPLDGSVALVTVHLNFLPSPTQPPQPADQPKVAKKDLKVNAKAAGSGSGKKAKVAEVQMNYGTEPDEIPGFVIRGMVEAWFNAHLQEFNHVFAVVSVNEAADTGSFAWLKPHDQGYANAKTGEDTGLFGVLAMTGDRTRGSLPFTVSPFAIPPGANSGLLIAPERVLKDLVAPAMPAAFPGTTASDFELVNDTVLRNTKEMIVPVETKTGKIAAHGFTVTIRGSEIILEIPKLEVEISDGITAVIDLHEYLKVTTKPQKDGTKILWFEQVDSQVTHQVVFADWVQVVTIAAEVIAGIILAAFGFNAAAKKFVSMGLSKIAARILAVIIAMVIGGVVAAITNIPKYIELLNTHQFDKLPSLEKLLIQGLERIEWPNQSGFELVSAGMSKSLRLGLDPKFAH